MKNASYFSYLVSSEIERIKNKRKIIDLSHGYGLLMEEVREFEDEVFKKEKKRDYVNCESELVQIAALCQLIHSTLVQEKL